MIETAILSNRVILPTGVKKAVVLIGDGIVIDVLPSLPEGEMEIFDLGDQVLMPAIIDPHVHINEPGRTEWEGFDTATKGAGAGGISTLIDMPLNSSPVTTTRLALEQKIIAAREVKNGEGKLHVDVGFWGGIIPGNSSSIEDMISGGVMGFKAFLTHSGIDEFPNVDEADLRLAMPLIAAHGLPLLVHCELGSGTPGTYKNRKSYHEYLASRPDAWEIDAIKLMIRLSEEFNCRVHIVHVSSAQSLPLIEHAKERGLPVTAETAPHYLYFSANNINDGQTLLKCAPPIRDEKNNTDLLAALKKGVIDFVATDHSPAPPTMKKMESGDFIAAWGGISSLQLLLPALWTIARKDGCTIEQVCNWLCVNTSKFTSLHRKKGKIERGMDADLVSWDPDKNFRVTESILHHRHKTTPYMNEELYGLVKCTWIKGKKVFDEGKFLHLNQGNILLNS